MRAAAIEMHPVHPDERFIHGGIYRLPAPGHWLVLGAGLGAIGFVGLACLALLLEGAKLGHVLPALGLTLAAAGGLVALRQHRLSLARLAGSSDVAGLLPERLRPAQILFMGICVAAMTILLMLTVPSRHTLVVPSAALVFVVIAALLVTALAAAIYGARWRLGRASYAERYGEADLRYFGVWDRI